MKPDPILLRLGLTPEQVAATAVRVPTGTVRPSTPIAQPRQPKRAAPPVRRVEKRELPTPETIRQIRERAAAGERQTAIAFDLGMSRAQVSRIVRGNSYRVDPGPVTRIQASRAHHKLRRLSPDQAQRIREAAAAGLSVMDLAKHYGIGHATISLLIRGESYADCPGPILYTAPRVRMGGAR